MKLWILLREDGDRPLQEVQRGSDPLDRPQKELRRTLFCRLRRKSFAARASKPSSINVSVPCSDCGSCCDLFRARSSAARPCSSAALPSSSAARIGCATGRGPGRRANPGRCRIRCRIRCWSPSPRGTEGPAAARQGLRTQPQRRCSPPGRYGRVRLGHRLRFQSSAPVRCPRPLFGAGLREDRPHAAGRYSVAAKPACGRSQAATVRPTGATAPNRSALGTKSKDPQRQ